MKYLQLTFRFWLRQNFLRRRLRWFGQQAQDRLLGSLLLPSLLPRFPVITPAFEATTAEADTTDLRMNLPEGKVRVVCSEHVSVNISYAEWIAPLDLPDNLGPPSKLALQTLSGYRPEGQYFFPARAYVESLSRIRAWQPELTHRCRAIRPPVQQLTASHSPTIEVLEPGTLLVYARLRSGRAHTRGP